MPKTLLLCEYPSLNGGERSLLAVLEHLRKASFELVAAAPPHGPLADALAQQGVDVIPFMQQCADGVRLSQQQLRRRLRRLLTASAPDVVHANSLSTSRLSGPVVAEVGIPSVGCLRDIVNISEAAMADINRHRRLLAVSHATRRWHVARGLAAAKTHVLYNGVDLDLFRPRPATGYVHRQLGLPDEALLVGAVGQIGARKGLDVLVDAARIVAPRAPRAHFIVVGQRYSFKEEAVEYETALHAACSRPPLAGRFHFLGVRRDVHRLLNELALLAHAARQEPLGRVLLEAAAAGTPIVAACVGGTREIFPVDSSTARLIAPDSAAELAAAILHLLSDEGLRRRLGQAARQRATGAFDARRSAQALASHYFDLVQDANTSCLET